MGDSGGPLVTYITGQGEAFYEQVAIVSGGFGSCGSSLYPGIYVRLEDFEVLSWINRIAFAIDIENPDPDPNSSFSSAQVSDGSKYHTLSVYF